MQLPARLIEVKNILPKEIIIQLSQRSKLMITANIHSTKYQQRWPWIIIPVDLTATRYLVCISGSKGTFFLTRYGKPMTYRITSRLKHKKPSSIGVQHPCRFWEVDADISHTCSMCSCRAFYEWAFSVCVFFFAIYLGFCIFGDIWVSRDPRYPAKIKKKSNKSHL